MTFRVVVKEVATDLGVYATFMPKPIAGAFGSGMHTHLSLFEGDVNAFHDPGDEYGLSKVGQALHRRAAAPRARDHRGHEPDGQLLQAPDRRLRGTRVRLLGPQQPLRARARPAAEAGQGELDPHRVPLARPGVQPVPRVLGDARRRAQGHRGGLRARARGDQQHLRDDARRARRRGHRLAAAVPRRGHRRDGGLRARRRGARRARLRLLHPQQARPSGPTTSPRSRRGSSTGTSGRCEPGSDQ